MEIVIDIPKEYYEALKEMSDESLSIIDRAIIRNGTPLPENHGRLIDADWVKNTLEIYVLNEYNGQFIRRSDIDTIPTIIEGSDNE